MKSDAEFGGAARAEYEARGLGARAAIVRGGPQTQAPIAQLLDRDEVEGVLSGAFYTPAASEPPRSRPRAREQAERPGHYKVICISLYNEDLERLDAMVDELKARGLTKANRSALIRHALSQVAVDKVPRGL